MTLEEQNKYLLAENRQLRDIIGKIEHRLAEHEAFIIKQGILISEQTARIAFLEEQLRQSKIYKNSGNSSKPPSTDISAPKRTQSLRESTGKKSGGQLGHQGETLKMTDNPDEIIIIEPNYCNKCGFSLEAEQSELHFKRQVIDIPPIQPKVTEYQNHKKKCPRCGHEQQGGFPEGVKNNIQYGANIEAIVAYYSVYQYIPYERLTKCLKQLFNLTISQGSIYNILNRMALKMEPICNYIKEMLLMSEQVGSDETSVKVNGKKWWIWVWQSTKGTYLSASKSRGSKAIEDEFPEGFKNSILSTDRWAAQLKTPAKGHQLCIAHLFRELEYLIQVEKNEWSIKLKQLFKTALELKEKKSAYSNDDIETILLEQSLDILLREDIPKVTNPKTLALQKSLLKNRESILTFLYNADTPPDNNGSERAIRNFKVKQKVSGQFKSGQEIFCIIRSVMDTCKKNGLDIMDSLIDIANFVPAE